VTLHSESISAITSPKLSIVTVTYNAEDELPKTLESIFDQIFTDYELIIIDGSSTDSTLEIIEKNSDKIAYWESKKDNGIYDAMNKALPVAKGEYIQFLNAGDFFSSNTALDDIFKNVVGEPTLIYGDINILHVDGRITYQKAQDFTFENILKRGTGVLCHQAMFVRKSKALPYSTKYTYKGELNWYFDLVELTDFSYQHISSPVVYYSLGGFGHKNFIRNRLDWLRVIYNRYGITTLLKSKIIVFLFKNALSRYPTLNNLYKVIRQPLSLFKC
jgi:glycosyltransferase involved in cell wall biosynthesis